ncbi:MAG TPA: bacteriohopanetetrol glucosamine biosynthesis glycosyltransferase HpnI [Methylocella sp.]|nr:bacteriohopanetetrol glucosamine biosynthesis glycosyltransferase HpnI [Methylocella sp.]
MPTMNFGIERTCLELVSDLCFVGSSLGCFYLSIAAIAVIIFPRRQRCAPAVRHVPVTILKPLCGAESDLSVRLASFCTQSYDAPIQILCGIHDHNDPASVEVKKVVDKMHSSRVELVVDVNEHGSNRKVSNLANLLPSAQHEILVISDSDIEVAHNYLSQVVAHLQTPGVGAVTCLYHGAARRGFWSRQAALAINAHLLPSIVVALTFGMARPCFGSTIAIRRSALAKLGGFQAFGNVLADDYAIGVAVRATEGAIAIPPFSVGHGCFETSLPAVLSHELRAARTIKSIAPKGYVGTIVTHPMALAVISTLLGSGHALILAAVALACRFVLCRCVEVTFRLPRQHYLHLPLRDLLSFAVFIMSFFGSRVTWRGVVYRLTADGILVPSAKRALRSAHFSGLADSGFSS